VNTAALAVAVGLVLGGCGGGVDADASEATDERVEEIRQLFAAAGVELVVTRDETTELLGRTVSMKPRATDSDARSRFGTFSVSVLDVDRWLALGLWDESDFGEIEWDEHHPEVKGVPERHWSAAKFYGRNVRLIWRTPEKRFDARWARLDEILSALDT
jgi:hypothetical protein